MKGIFKILRGAFALVCLAGIGAFTSCSTGEAIQQALDSGMGLSAEAPAFLACKAVSSRSINFQFSVPVRVVSINFDPAQSVEFTGDGATVNVVLDKALNPGDSVTADLLVEDEAGNTLNVLVPFRGRNDRMPKLLITELRTEYSKTTNILRVEFVEFFTLDSGNLGALRLFAIGNTRSPPLVFEFPPVEVKKGEYILIHLRTLDTDIGAANETGNDRTLSGGNEALPDVRDFWISGLNKLLHKKEDIVYFMDQDDKIIDAVMLSEKPESSWSKGFIEAAELLHEQGAWLSAGGGIPGPQDAVNSSNSTATKSVSRDKEVDTNRAGDWYITAHSTKNPGTTPGKPNNPLRFE